MTGRDIWPPHKEFSIPKKLIILASAPRRTDGLLRMPLYPGQVAHDGYLLPSLPVAERDQLVHGFSEYISALNAANADKPLWSLTWLSRRDQHNNGLLGDLHFLLCLAHYLDSVSDMQPRSVVIENPALASAVARLADDRGWHVERPSIARINWIRLAVRRRIRHFTGTLALLRHGIRWRDAAHRYRNKSTQDGDATVVLSSVFHDHTFDDAASYRDTYFGRLTTWLLAEGETCLVVGQVQGDPVRIAKGAAEVREPRVECHGRYLRRSDILVTAWQVFLAGFALSVRTPPALSFISDVERLARASLVNRAVEIGLGRLIGIATQRALDANPRARVIRMHENNPWERAVDAAAKHREDPRDVTGYFHCAVLPAHLKNIYFAEDAPSYPKPDRVVCTGKNARDVYASMGSGATGEIVGGCDLRNAFESSVEIEPKPIKRVLVAFEGLMKMRGLLRFVYDVAPGLSHVTFVLRGHPALPLERIAPEAGVNLQERDNIEFSREPSLAADIAACDVLLYQGSTVALTAAAMAKPLLAFAGGSLKSDDPLFACASMKWRVATREDLQSAIAQIEQLSAADYQTEMRSLQDYVNGYARRATDETMRVFQDPRRENRPIEEMGTNR